ALREQVVFGSAYIQRGVTALFEGVAFDKAHNIGSLFTGPVSDHRYGALALASGPLGPLRITDEVANLPGLVLIGIGCPGFGRAEALGGGRGRAVLGIVGFLRRC